MDLLLDQGLPRSTVRHLANAGIAAEHVGSLGMATATDDEILTADRLRQAIVVTLNADFHHVGCHARNLAFRRMNTYRRTNGRLTRRDPHENSVRGVNRIVRRRRCLGHSKQSPSQLLTHWLKAVALRHGTRSRVAEFVRILLCSHEVN